MIKFYANKIQNSEINSNTGAAWNVNDVPKFWRKKVEEMLNS